MGKISLHPGTKTYPTSSQYNPVVVRLLPEKISSDVEVTSDTTNDSIMLLGQVSRGNANVTICEHRSHRLTRQCPVVPHAQQLLVWGPLLTATGYNNIRRSLPVKVLM